MILALCVCVCVCVCVCARYVFKKLKPKTGRKEQNEPAR